MFNFTSKKKRKCNSALEFLLGLTWNKSQKMSKINTTDYKLKQNETDNIFIWNKLIDSNYGLHVE